MADEHWYQLKVRSGFESVVARRLRRLHLAVLVPERKAHDERCYIYCRFSREHRQTVTSVPGVLDILRRVEHPEADPRRTMKTTRRK